MASDYYLKLKGIEGESKDDKHANQIDVLSFSWGASQPGTFGQSSGGTAGKVSMSDFSFMMYFSKASTELMAACASGKHIEEGILYCRKSTGDGGQEEYMTFTFSPVIVAGFQTSGSGGGSDVPMDSVQLNYGKIKVEYKMQVDDKGTLQAGTPFGWSIEKNAKF
jgi:type VI secretion system secreted protein Hcp